MNKNQRIDEDHQGGANEVSNPSFCSLLKRKETSGHSIADIQNAEFFRIPYHI